MKKTFCTIFAALMLCTVLASCQNDSANTKDSTEAQTDAQTEAQTMIDTSADKEYNFDDARVNSHILLTSDGEKALTDCTDFFVQNPAVAKVLEDGTVRAQSEGVTLIAYKNSDGVEKVAACCVLPEGVRPDSSGSSPQVVEVGSSTTLSGVSRRDSHFSSSNNDVATVDDDATLHFLSPGYTVITVEGVSVPTFYSYIVFER